MEKTKVSSVILIVLVTLVITAAQVCYKYGMDGFPEIMPVIVLFFGFFFYGFGALLLIIALRGGELSILYPFLALSYIWVSIVSPMLFPADSMNPMKWAGVFFIILGISAIGVGSRR